MIQYFKNRIKYSLLLIVLSFLSINSTFCQEDRVQSVLKELAQKNEDAVAYIEATNRYYLTLPFKSVPENILKKLQVAFIEDVETLCKYYGWKYLIDWKLLASKAARESFWGTSFLCNRTMNYFGIRHANKTWACDIFDYCDSYTKDDPEPAEFIIFPDFKSSLWMFIHTMYSPHYLKRLPDQGSRVAQAIQFEKKRGTHYWRNSSTFTAHAKQLGGTPYNSEEIIYTWSEHPINNLCVNCNRATDRQWISKIEKASPKH